MKKLIIALALAAAGFSSLANAADAPDAIKVCNVSSIKTGAPVATKWKAIVADWGNKFAFFYIEEGKAPNKAGLTSPILNHRVGAELEGFVSSVRGDTYAAAGNDMYTYQSDMMHIYDLFSNCAPADKALVAQTALKDVITASNIATDAARAQTAQAEDDDVRHGSEFEERGDIARPEFDGANTFTGEAVNFEGKPSGTVTLTRDESGDVTLSFGGDDQRTYKLDPDMNGTDGTYEETRLSTDFFVGNGMGYSITHTKIVK
ncbi:hypothetical protein EX011_21625 [Salmonella enterica]|nr:hypothetical protein [Salmonella enterica]EJF7575702.1 hypothetical protein [Salmonella enterica subsp. enterica]HAV7961504.1 hypothetical protein [Escherichia coli]